MASIALTRRLARAIVELAASSHAQEVLIEHRLDAGGEVVTVSERQRERRVLGEFQRPFESADWCARREG